MLWYLAHPYSSNPEENFEKVNELAWLLIHRFKAHVYSPISHTHPIALVAGDRKVLFDYGIWMPLDQEIAGHCDGLLLAPGWEDSKGCRAEIDWFREKSKPVYILDQNGYIIGDYELWRMSHL